MKTNWEHASGAREIAKPQLEKMIASAFRCSWRSARVPDLAAELTK